MRRTNMAVRYLALAAVTVLIAGCDNWSINPYNMHGNPQSWQWTPGEAAGKAPGGANFQQALAKEYTDLSGQLTQQNDWVDSDYFARKSLAVSKGQDSPPEFDTNWSIPLEQPFGFRTQIRNERARLLAALDGGGRTNKPAVAARAQAKFDCWVERMEDDWQSAKDGPCYRDYMAAMAELLGSPPPAPQPVAGQRQYNVYFEFNEATLTPEARQIIAQVAADAKANVSATVSLVGKADLTGSDNYNIELSKRRADAVTAALVAAGVPANRIGERWVGFHEPPVPTPFGVREPRNRVVQVTIP